MMFINLRPVDQDKLAIDGLRARIDREADDYLTGYAREIWRGDEWWQASPGDAERYEMTPSDMPRLCAIWRVFDFLAGNSRIGGDLTMLEGPRKALPWLDPDHITPEMFGRFAKLAGADEWKGQNFFRRLEERIDMPFRAPRAVRYGKGNYH